MTAKIHARPGQCRCGCEGRDPWHRSSYRRELRDVTPATGTALVGPFGRPQAITARARVRLPWGDATAVLVQLEGIDFGWCLETATVAG